MSRQFFGESIQHCQTPQDGSIVLALWLVDENMRVLEYINCHDGFIESFYGQRVDESHTGGMAKFCW